MLFAPVAIPDAKLNIFNPFPVFDNHMSKLRVLFVGLLA